MIVVPERLPLLSAPPANVVEEGVAAAIGGIAAQDVPLALVTVTWSCDVQVSLVVALPLALSPVLELLGSSVLAETVVVVGLAGGAGCRRWSCRPARRLGLDVVLVMTIVGGAALLAFRSPRQRRAVR